MTPRIVSLLGLVGCAGDPAEDTGADTAAADSGTTTFDCDEELVPVALEPCGDTTAYVPLPTPSTSTPFEVDATGTGWVTEVGSLTAVGGATAVGVLPACDASFPHQVRLVDAADDVWTFGWRVDGALAEDSTAGFAIDQEITFVAWSAEDPWLTSFALTLSDADGPVFLVEREPRLTEAERGGIGVTVDRTDVCRRMDGDEEQEHYLVSFSWDGGEVQLRTGQSAAVSLPARDLELVVTRAWEWVACDDGCSVSEWAYWAEAR